MDFALLILYLAFITIICYIVTHTVLYMFKRKDVVIKQVPLYKKVSITKEQIKKIGLNTLNAYADEYKPIDGKSYLDLGNYLYKRAVNETQEKYKETLPKHSTRIKPREARKLRNKRKEKK